MKPLVVNIAGEEKYTRLLAGKPETSGMKAGYVTLKPGESVGEHSTGSREEAIIFLQGRGEVCCAQKPPAAVEENTLVYIPPGLIHCPIVYKRVERPFIFLYSMPTNKLQEKSYKHLVPEDQRDKMVFFDT